MNIAVQHVHLRSGVPLRRERPIVRYAPPKKPSARIIYEEPIGPIFGRDFIHVCTEGLGIGFKGILREVSAKHQILPLEILSQRRTKATLLARFELFYRLRHETRFSLPQIGRLVGGRDHTTAMSAVKKYTQLLASGKVRL